MRCGDSKSSLRLVLAVVFAASLLAAAPARAGDKRFLVRYDHGTANLPAWTGLRLYVGADRVRVFADNELLHDIPARDITGVSHELRAPFDPAKAMERTFNDTLGSCSTVIDCPVLGAAGVVGAAGVGVATIFTPKEMVITLNWTENGQPRELAMKVAWYQRDFILGALEKATGRQAAERGSMAKPNAQPAPNKKGSPAQSASLSAPAPTPPPPQAEPAREIVRRFEWILDRPVRVGQTELEPGFYIVLVQERTGGKASLVFLDDSVRDAQESKVVARATADIIEDASSTGLRLIFRDGPEGNVLAEIRLPGRILRLID